MEPKDGFHIFPHELGSMEISLHVGLYQQGVLDFDHELGAASVEVYACSNPEPADYGARNRAWLAAEAICRYINTGGSWDELASIIATMQRMIPGTVVRDGWHLFDTYVDTEGNHTHVFCENSAGRVVRWVEGEYVDTGLTLNDLRREAEEEDVEEEAANSQVRSSPLLRGPDHAGSGEADGGDASEVREPDCTREEV